MNSVSFYTNAYEKDWKDIVDYRFEDKIKNLNYPFEKSTLIITNVLDRDRVEKEIINKKHNYIFTDDYSDEILNFYDIDENSFNGGYWYSIAPLTAIYFCKTEYMLFLTGDSYLENLEKNWIDDAINEMRKNNLIKVANPLWNNMFDSAKQEEQFYVDNGLSDKQNQENWFYTLNFSDQCFLIKVEDFRNKIYNHKNDLSERFYPKYAGDSFEKRVSSYLKNNRFYRITNKTSSYIHK